MTHRKCAIRHNSLPEAMEACLAHARIKHQRSVEMEGLAWHRANVERHAEPELDLEGQP